MYQDRVIYTSGLYRIVETLDETSTYKELAGDVFDPEVNDEISAAQLAREEEEFQLRIDSEGVYGYLLQKWTPDTEEGIALIDSVWGFVGKYSETNKHYIVQSMILRIGEDNK